jgi:septal ring factor EnvC (AmiA/AmiB activator)
MSLVGKYYILARTKNTSGDFGVYLFNNESLANKYMNNDKEARQTLGKSKLKYEILTHILNLVHFSVTDTEYTNLNKMKNDIEEMYNKYYQYEQEGKELYKQLQEMNNNIEELSKKIGLKNY